MAVGRRLEYWWESQTRVPRRPRVNTMQEDAINSSASFYSLVFIII